MRSEEPDVTSTTCSHVPSIDDPGWPGGSVSAPSSSSPPRWNRSGGVGRHRRGRRLRTRLDAPSQTEPRPAALLVLGIGTLLLGIVPRVAMPILYALVLWPSLMEVGGTSIDCSWWLLDMTISGEGSVLLRQLIADDAKAAVRGDGTIMLTATNHLTARISGTGAVLYGGNPPHLAAGHRQRHDLSRPRTAWTRCAR